MNQPFLVRGHAGLECGPLAVGDGFARFTDRGVLKEIVFKSGIRGSKGHGRRAVAVVDHVVCGKQETGAVPRPPLVVAVNGSDTHVHRGSVGKGKGSGEVVGTGGSRRGKGGPKGREMPRLVCFRAPILVIAQLNFHVCSGVEVVGERWCGHGLKEEIR